MFLDMEGLFTVLVVGAILVLTYRYFKLKSFNEERRRRAENKVRMSDRILPGDIEILARTYSPLLDDAIALRHAQREQGRDPYD